MGYEQTACAYDPTLAIPAPPIIWGNHLKNGQANVNTPTATV